MFVQCFFLPQDQDPFIWLNCKKDEPWPIKIGVPQGSCVLPILAVYFTSPMIGEVHHVATSHIKECTELSTPLVRDDKATLSPTTLYVDDGAILASGP